MTTDGHPWFVVDIPDQRSRVMAHIGPVVAGGRLGSFGFTLGADLPLGRVTAADTRAEIVSALRLSVAANRLVEHLAAAMAAAIRPG